MTFFFCQSELFFSVWLETLWLGIYLEHFYYEGIYIFITSVEIVLLSSEPNPYELAFIYEVDILQFYDSKL